MFPDEINTKLKIMASPHEEEIDVDGISESEEDDTDVDVDDSDSSASSCSEDEGTEKGPRRKGHNALERRRRTELSSCYSALKTSVRKRHPGTRLSRDRLLELATTDILEDYLATQRLKEIYNSLCAREEMAESKENSGCNEADQSTGRGTTGGLLKKRKADILSLHREEASDLEDSSNSDLSTVSPKRRGRPSKKSKQ